MKKILLSAAAIFAAMSLNAQEVAVFNADNALNLDSENGTALTAGTVIGQTESIIATIGADDTYKPQSATFTVAGTEITGGLQGATNPKDADGGVPATTLVQPASGAFFQFEAKADGTLYVLQKASSNKAYSVFEEGTAISYAFTAIGDASTLLGGVYSFSLPYEVENEQFVVKNSIEWAEQEFLKATNPEAYNANWKEETADDGTTKKTWDPAIKVNGLGIIKFPVYKDCKYIVNANGSKITAAGFVFSPADNVSISADGVTLNGEGGDTPTPEPGEGKILVWEENLAGLDAVPYWFGSSEGTDATAEATADGIALMNPRKQDQIWTPQTVVTADAFTLEEDHNYQVEIEVKVPAGEGTYQVQIGSWATNFQHEVPVVGNDDWQTLVIDFPEFGGSTDENAAHVVFQNGWVVGTSVVKSVKVYEISEETAIKTVKAGKKFDGAIYNLAGQKVNASYKGVVIKDGKKYIQK